MLHDQILEPNDFPWTNQESQVVAFEVKQRIRTALETPLLHELQVISNQIDEFVRNPPEPDEPEPEPEPEPDEDDAYA